MSVHLFGIRHHGPGCARSLRSALETLQPDAILVEGPPDAEELLSLMFAEGMQPPVAILLYPPDTPERAVFYPFAEFSPEWQAARYAHEQQIPLRWMDLPYRHRLAMEDALAAAAQPEAGAQEAGATEQANPGGEATDNADVTPSEPMLNKTSPSEPTIEDDPLGALALAAGYSDRELWWEHQIEQRQDPVGLFEGIMEAMTVLRRTAGEDAQHEPRRFEAEREAFMRQAIRTAQREGCQRIAVICGAWHVPALASLEGAKQDTALLKGLPKTKVTATWTPWTYSRLSYRSGYGAGIRSPGWYEHLWLSPQSAPTRWIAQAARLMRNAGLDASSASVIETVRLAESLAALRDLPMPGLAELTEAIRSVLCAGDEAPLALIRRQLEVGERLGTVPEATPALPLQKDLEAQQKRLRLKPTTEIKTLDLDLRKAGDRARSYLLHRLNLLGIAWGETQTVYGKSGTFHEVWRLQWDVEFVVQLIEASVWGNTIESAATAKTLDCATNADSIATLTTLLDQALLANLFSAVAPLLERLQQQAAVAADVQHLMEALPPLARVARYGDVRQTRAEHLRPVLDGFLERIFIGLPPACSSLDQDAAEAMSRHIDGVQESLDLLNEGDDLLRWQATLATLLDQESIHGLVRGRACRLLLEKQALTNEELHRRTRLALSPAVPALHAAQWIEGLLRGSGMVLLHQDAVWVALDRWLRELDVDTFTELLPLLRRAFSGFQSPERRAMGEKVKHLVEHAGAAERLTPAALHNSLHPQRAEMVLPILAHLLGAEQDKT